MGGTNGEKETQEQTKHRLRQSRLNGLSDLDAELNFPWGDSTDEKPDGVTRIFFQM
jgi:hypothetical protein